MPNPERNTGELDLRTPTEKERDNAISLINTYNQIIKDDCEREADTRKILARFDKSDSYITYNSPMLAEEAMKALAAAEAERDALREAIHAAVAFLKGQPTPGPGAGT